MSNSISQEKDLIDLSSESDGAINHKFVSSENVYPIHVFPKLFREMAIDLKKSLDFPIDYTGTAILTAIATTIGTSAKVRVKSGWDEYASIYSCLIGNAGANKTHPVNKIFSPIKDFDNRNHDDFISKYQEYEEYRKLPKKEKFEIDEVLLPILTKSILGNFTPEALTKILNENLRGCTVLSDELATFFEGMNNHSKGDQTSVYLSFWNNQPTTIDRKTNPIPLLIKAPFLSIIGGLQPRMLNSVFPRQKLNNGFYQRFLFAFPKSTLKQPISNNEFNNELFERYKNYISNYFESNEVKEVDGLINSKILNWTAEAKDFFYEWHSDNCDLVNENQDSIEGEIASKFDNHFVRLSLLLQLMEDPNSDNIQIEAVQGAKELCQYYMNCSFKVLDNIRNPREYVEALVGNKKRFYETIAKSFTTAEAIEIGKKFEFQKRRINDFLKDNILFKRIKQGHYEKNIET